ncbi:nodulation protein NfeD [bacterium AH-315-J21]|nr:nodulation protein NfeD [bacterium AH-315-J21]
MVFCSLLLLPLAFAGITHSDEADSNQATSLETTPTDTIEVTTTDTSAKSATRKLVYILNIDGAIGTVTAKRVVDAIEKSEQDNAEALIIQLDTPGGFTKATWAIDKAILNSHVPVIVYIGPAGARAGSAGVYITYAAHIAAMAYGTNLGSAHPVGGQGEDIDSVMNEKVTNDAVASIRTMADKHGRNAEWAERAVRESVNITDTEADSLGVIDVRAKSIDELLTVIDGRTVETPVGEKTLQTKEAHTVTLTISFIESILRIITSPDIAFLLFSIGGLGIILELYHPGAIFPGVIGGISLILAFYAFQTLPINTAGLLLIILSLVLFMIEIKVTSYGLLTVGGIVSMSLGGMMLIDSSNTALQVSKGIIFSVAFSLGILLALVGYLVAHSYRHQITTGPEGMVGEIGQARSEINLTGSVFACGELWKATSAEPIEKGAEIIVEKIEGIHLHVRKK